MSKSSLLTFIDSAMKRTESNLIILLAVIFALLSVVAHAQVQQPVNIPDGLSIEHKEDLNRRRSVLIGQRDILSAKLQSHNQKCSKVRSDSPEVEECHTNQKLLVAEIQEYNDAVKGFDQTVEKMLTVYKEQLEAQIHGLRNQIRMDEQAIRNLGFDKRAADFEEWVKLADDARKEFEEQTLDSIAELLLTGSLDANKAFIKNIGSFNSFSTQKLIGRLNSAGIRNQRIWNLIREVGATKGKPEAAKATRELIELIEKEGDLLAIAQNASNDPESIKTKAEAVVTVLSWGLEGPLAGFLQSDVQFMFSSLYNASSRYVSISNIEKLTTLTEEELKSLKKLSDVMKKHIDQLNRAKKELASLSDN